MIYYCRKSKIIHNPCCSENEAEKLVARIDDDGSLDISFEEWRDYLMFHPRLPNLGLITV